MSFQLLFEYFCIRICNMHFTETKYISPNPNLYDCSQDGKRTCQICQYCVCTMFQACAGSRVTSVRLISSLSLSAFFHRIFLTKSFPGELHKFYNVMHLCADSGRVYCTRHTIFMYFSRARTTITIHSTYTSKKKSWNLFRQKCYEFQT